MNAVQGTTKVFETGSTTFTVGVEWTTVVRMNCYGFKGRVATYKYRVRTAAFVTLFKMYDSVSTRVGRLSLTLDIPTNREVLRCYRRVNSCRLCTGILMTRKEVVALRDTVLEVSAWTVPA